MANSSAILIMMIMEFQAIALGILISHATADVRGQTFRDRGASAVDPADDAASATTFASSRTTFLRAQTSGKQTRIIGGARAQSSRYPYSVSLQDSIGHYCGGSLIAPNIVLTAAHCGVGGRDVVVNCATLNDDMEGCRSGGQVIRIAEELLHPRWNEKRTDNDFNLVVLSHAADMDGVTLVRLNTDEHFPDAAQAVTVTGFGDTERSETRTELSPELMEVQINVISNTQCEKAKGNSWDHTYRNQITKNMLCTEAKDKDACQGDSGGPLVAKGGNEDVQVGVVSWGIGCAYLPGVFARVSEAYDWIEEVVCERGVNLEATTFWCGGEVASPPSAAPHPPPPRPPRPTNGNPYWRTVLAEDFEGGFGDFQDGGSDAKKVKRKKGRDGIVKLQRGYENGAAAAVVLEDVDVTFFFECRVVVSFYMIGMEENDTWRVEYAADGSEEWQVAKAFGTKNYRNKQWWDGEKATFSVNGTSRVNLRLRCMADSRKDDVLFDNVKLECQ